MLWAGKAALQRRAPGDASGPLRVGLNPAEHGSSVSGRDAHSGLRRVSPTSRAGMHSFLPYTRKQPFLSLCSPYRGIHKIHPKFPQDKPITFKGGIYVNLDYRRTIMQTPHILYLKTGKTTFAHGACIYTPNPSSDESN